MLKAYPGVFCQVKFSVNSLCLKLEFYHSRDYKTEELIPLLNLLL